MDTSPLISTNTRDKSWHLWSAYSSSTSKLSLHEQFFLSPFEKWRLYHRFPYKLVLHIVLILLILCQVWVYDTQHSSYIRASYKNWKHFFFPSLPSCHSLEDCKIYTPEDTKLAFTTLRDNYFDIKNLSVADYEYVKGSNGRMLPIRCAVTNRSSTTKSTTTNYELRSKTDIGPFDHCGENRTALATYIHSIHSMEFILYLKDIHYGPLDEDCFIWRLSISLKREQSAYFQLKIDNLNVKDCDAGHIEFASEDGLLSTKFTSKPLKNNNIWLNLLIWLVTTIYLALCLKSLYRRIRILKRVLRLEENDLPDHNGEEEEERKQQPQRPRNTKLAYFSAMNVTRLVTLLLLWFNFTWNLCEYITYMPLSPIHRFIQAISAMLLCLTFVGYFDHYEKFYIMVLTLKMGIPRVLQFLVGVFPIFVGYALIGMIYFGSQLSAFGSFSMSLMTLFSVMNGDSILDNFKLLEATFPVVGQIYLYSFISLFMYVVLNIFIAIMEDAFFRMRKSPSPIKEMAQMADDEENEHEKYGTLRETNIK